MHKKSLSQRPITKYEVEGRSGSEVAGYWLLAGITGRDWYVFFVKVSSPLLRDFIKSNISL
jgi:hypothetical protein